ncbi:uncharacterized protein N7529_001072 [Penicillium soppii]|uniref:uncharacterized protein n=1 Tax=Penicillium soppii TaxID=69789 RepID=UPI0025475A44|nr:uncharacterized protein N7529_001072 [Penicillium soppii]KAJ5882400.1 hypothetical protein N7529_001072 [Penicillium soppii]
MGFLHVPTFMERLKGPTQLETQQSGLIYIMCALSAPFYYADTIGFVGEEDQKKEIQFFDAGKGWAEAASQCLFSGFGQTGTERLMTEVLLHEYYLRQGDYAKGFMISGQIARHLQILQINIEANSDPSCQKISVSGVTKESRRRLVWACYILDAFIECGIDQLRLILAEDIHVQLPCSEELFVRSTPCITETLTPGQYLPSVTPTPKTITEASNNLDMRGFYIRALNTRSKILKYVKCLAGEVPWQRNPTSRFHILEDELHTLETSIPPALQISTENMYLFKASGRLSLYFSLHILISQNYHDLYRIGVSRLVFPNSATQWIRENAPSAFLVTCHTICAQKAVYIASLLKDLWVCHRLSIVDTPFAMYIQVCSSVIVTTLASWGRDEPLIPGMGYGEYRAMLRDNVIMLRFLQRYIKASMYYESAVQALNRFDELFSLDCTGPGSANTPALVDARAGGSADRTGGSSQIQLTLEYVLNPLGTYPMARKQIENGDGEGEVGNCPGEDVPVAEEIAVLDDSIRPSGEDDLGSFTFPSEMLFAGNVFDWEPEMPMMPGIGYPTFLGHFSVDAPRGL